MVTSIRASVIVRCTLSFGRGQELKPFFLLDLYILQRPFSHVLDTSVNPGWIRSLCVSVARRRHRCPDVMAQSFITSLSNYFFPTTKFHLFNSYIYNLLILNLILFLMSHFSALYVPIQGLSGQVQDMSWRVSIEGSKFDGEAVLQEGFQRQIPTEGNPPSVLAPP